jgi:hypothetical protein
MDDLAHRVDEGFKRAHADTRSLREDMNAGFAQAHAETSSLRADMNNGFNRIDADLRSLRVEMAGLQRVLIQAAFGLIAAILGLAATQL